MLVSSGNSRFIGLDRLDVLPVHKLIWLDVCTKGWSDGFEGLEPYSFCKIAKPKKTRHILVALGIQSPCQRMIGMSNHLLSIVFGFHYHSQKVIGSLW